MDINRECGICYEINEMVALPCGHLCCKSCFNIMFCEHRGQICPFCRKSIRELEELANKLIEFKGKLIPLKYINLNKITYFTINLPIPNATKIQIYEPIITKVANKYLLSYDHNKIILNLKVNCMFRNMEEVFGGSFSGNRKYRCIIFMEHNCNSSEEDDKNYELVKSFETNIKSIMKDIYPNLEMKDIFKNDSILSIKMHEKSEGKIQTLLKRKLTCMLAIHVRSILKLNDKLYLDMLLCDFRVIEDEYEKSQQYMLSNPFLDD